MKDNYDDAVQHSDQQSQQIMVSGNVEAALTIVLQHLQFGKKDMCTLLCVSKSVHGTVLASFSGKLHRVINADSQAAAHRFAAWLVEYGGSLKSVSIKLPGHSQRGPGQEFSTLLNRWTEWELVHNNERKAVEDILAGALRASAGQAVAAAPDQETSGATLQSSVSSISSNPVHPGGSSSSSNGSRFNWLEMCHMPSPSPTLLAVLPSSIRSLKLGNMYTLDLKKDSLEGQKRKRTEAFVSAMSHLTNLQELKLEDEGAHPVLMKNGSSWVPGPNEDTSDYAVNDNGLLKIISALPALKSLYIEQPHRVDVNRVPGHVKVEAVENRRRLMPYYARHCY